ncbi:MAG: portal protein, partial [Solirubrobacteraceae bacterium]
MADERAREIIRLWERLNGDRTTWLVHWQDVTDYMLPNRADYIIERTPGMKRMAKVFDSTPIWAAEQSAGGFYGLLTSPTLQWFFLEPEDDRLGQVPEVAAWLDEAARRLYAIFNGPRYNFASQAHELYLDLVTIGTAAMAVLESPRSKLRFSTRHMRECVIQENEEDRVDTLVRRWKYTAKQAVETWGEAAGERVVKAAADRPDEKFEFLHCVRPRAVRSAGRNDARHKAFESVYVSAADGAVISEGGFEEFPYLVPRFSKMSFEIYGRGSGMTALPDVKMLNAMAKTVLKGAQKVVDPPLQVPDDGFMVPIKTVPGGLNYYRAGSQDRIEPMQTNGQISLGIEMVNALRQAIKSEFYLDLLAMPSDPSDPLAAGKGVTATWVVRDRDQKLVLMAPILARLYAEFLGPLVDRTFAIAWRQSRAMRWGAGALLPEPPAELSGAALRVRYVSPIEAAQNASRLDGIGRVVQTAQI